MRVPVSIEVNLQVEHCRHTEALSSPQSIQQATECSWRVTIAQVVVISESGRRGESNELTKGAREADIPPAQPEMGLNRLTIVIQ